MISEWTLMMMQLWGHRPKRNCVAEVAYINRDSNWVNCRIQLKSMTRQNFIKWPGMIFILFNDSILAADNVWHWMRNDQCCIGTMWVEALLWSAVTRNVKISDSRILNDGIINITSLSLQLNERCKGIPFSILMQLREEHRLRVIVN